MMDAMSREITGNTLKDLLAKKILPDTIPKEIIHECQFIYPLQDVHIRKIKVSFNSSFAFIQVYAVSERPIFI